MIQGISARMFSDGGARGNPGPAGIGYVLEVQGEDPIHYGEYIGATTNNQAEYQALFKGLMKAAEIGVNTITCYLDSELVVKQLNGQYKMKNEALRPWYDQILALKNSFQSVSFEHVPRAKNKEADKLVNEAIDRATQSK